jgi:hypothetical protein
VALARPDSHGFFSIPRLTEALTAGPAATFSSWTLRTPRRNTGSLWSRCICAIALLDGASPVLTCGLIRREIIEPLGLSVTDAAAALGVTLQ